MANASAAHTTVALEQEQASGLAMLAEGAALAATVTAQHAAGLYLVAGVAI